MPDRTKLPKWAQDELRNLEAIVAEQRRALNEQVYEPRYDGDTPTVFLRTMIEGRYHEKAIGGEFVTVVFRNARHEVEVTASRDGSYPVIRATARNIRILPQASNTVLLQGDPEFAR